jgi:hypothetical protein
MVDTPPAIFADFPGVEHALASKAAWPARAAPTSVRRDASIGCLGAAEAEP